MKVLVKIDAEHPAKNEVYEQPWLDWINAETGHPMTEPCFGYALVDIPDDLAGLTIPEDYDVTDRIVEPTEEGGEQVVYKDGVFVKARYDERVQ